MPPAALARVVARAGLAALPAAGLAAVLDDQLHRAGRHFKAHVRDVPSQGDSKDLGVEVAVARPRTVRPYRRGPDSLRQRDYPHGFLKTR